MIFHKKFPFINDGLAVTLLTSSCKLMH